VRLLAWLLGLLGLTLATGCSDPGATEVRAWTFVAPDGARSAVVLPTHVNDRLPRATTTYRLETRVAVPADGADRVLVIPRLVARARLRADGAPCAPLDESDERAGYRAKGPHAWLVPGAATRDGAIDLELTIDHTWTQSAWLDTTPRLTTSPDGGASFRAQRAFNAATAVGAFGFAAFAGYLYLVIWLTDRRRDTYGWFALTGLSGFAYPLFQSGLVAGLLGPFETVMAGVGVATAVVAQVHFTALFFGAPRPSRAWDAAWIASVVPTFASAGYFTSTTVGGWSTILLAAPALGSQVALFARLARRKPAPPHLFTVLGGWALLSVVALPDFAAWLGFGEILGGTRTACLGVLVIALLTTATISRAHTRALRDAEVLNEELRRQIAARSRQLAEALARLGRESGERPLAPGDDVEGRYEVVRVLGAGAGGTVYLVERVSDRAPFAMKIVKSGGDAHALARLAREAQLAAEVKHANVISIVDVDVAAGGFLYVVMEYVPGSTLREHRADFGRLDWALPVLAQIAEALAVIHERGIVHRDLKPANVLVLASSDPDAPPLVKISDFGIARGDRAVRVTERPPAANDAPASDGTVVDVRGDAALLTETGVVMGTPLYMAPEAVGGARDVTAAVDVFAFGVIAYELIAGRLPFRDSPALAQLDGVSVAAPPPLLTYCAECPGEVAHLVDRCLAFEAGDRPSAREAYAVLSRVHFASRRATA
jgi:serine/threonine-protein kinase